MPTSLAIVCPTEMLPVDVRELAAALDEAGDDAPVYVADKPGDPASARQLAIVIEQWPDSETGEPKETVVIYPV